MTNIPFNVPFTTGREIEYVKESIKKIICLVMVFIQKSVLVG